MTNLINLSLSLWLVALSMTGSLWTEKKSDSLPQDHIILWTNETLVIEEQPTIHHSGFSPDDYRQEIVQEAYKLGGLEFLTLIECENGLRNPKAVGDGGMSFWLCQLNIRRHWEPLEEERNERTYQLSACYSKWKSGTKFYWPQRKIGGKRCWEIAKKRFMIAEDFTLVD